MIGAYKHTLDAKGRIIVPSKFREELGSTFYITKGLNKSLFAYPQQEWAVLEAKIKALPMVKSRDLQLFFFSSAFEAEADKQGRVLITPDLREYAGLTKDVTVIGAANRMEIWDSAKWQEMSSALTDEKIAEAMEAMDF